MNKQITQLSFVILIALTQFISIGTKAQTTPTFTGSTTLSVCQNSTFNSIDANLAITDASTTATETWSISSSPAHGTLSGFNAIATAIGGALTPSGLTYTPTSGYSGPDVFTVQVNNGTNTASQTVNVTIIAAPIITSISPTVGIPGSSVTITGTHFNTTAANDYVYFGSVKAIVTSASSTSLTVTAPNSSVYYPAITVENNVCALSASSRSPYLPTYNNTGLVANTINFATHVNFTAGSNDNHLAYGDFDGDGKTDIVNNNYGSSNLTVYLNTSTVGTANFASPITIGSVTAPGPPSVADIDGDGLLDVVVMSAAPPGKMYIFRNTSTVSNISFASAVVISYTTNANATSIIDIDGDGLPDVVGSILSTMSVFRNTSTVGNISFASRVNFAASATINSIATGDIDGDGKADVVVGTSGTTVSAFRNTSTAGSVSFAARQDFTTLGTSNSIAIGDIDGDGKFDLLTTEAAAGTPSLGIFPGSSTVGTISFGTRQDFTTGSTPSTISIGDFDGDSKPDIAVTSISAGKVNVFRNTSSSGTISLASKVDFTSGNGAAGLVATDIDGDGKMDLVTTNQSAATMSVLLNNPLSPIIGTTTVCTGSTTTLSDATSGGTWSSSNTSIATVNSSTGVVTGVAAGTVTITYAGTAGSTFADNTTSTTVTVNTSPTITFTADATSSTCVNTNVTYTTQSGMSNYVWTVPGTLGTDYSISSGGISTTDNSVTLKWLTSGTKTITVNYTNSLNCSATTAKSSTATTIQMPPTITSVSPTVAIPGTSVTITGTYFNSTAANNYVYFGSVQASVTAASATSLTVTAPNGSVYAPAITVENNVCALIGAANSSFLATYNNAAFVAHTVNFAPRVNITVGSSANRIGYGDVDGDGKTDIIVNNSGTGTVSVYRNTSTSGTVTFASAVVVATGLSFPGQPTMGDLDGDGKLDLVFMQASGPGAVRVYLNTSTTGSISFASPLIISYFTNANASAIADIDGDGKLDIIGNYLTTMSVFRNTSSVGSLSFASRVDFSTPGNINFITAGDVDGDSKPDLLVSTSGGTVSLSVFRNTSTLGSISLATRQDFTTVSGSGNYVALADIDGDGMKDVLTINQGLGSFSIFPNTSTSGTISLGTRQDFTVGSNSSSLFIADFDGDGKPDISATSISNSKVYVFLNNSSTGSFAFYSTVAFTSGSGAASMVATDIDGDGKSDIVVLNQSTTTMSIFRNDPLQPITGTTAVCLNSTTTLSEATPNGTWSSINPSIASVNSTTGVVTGVATGTINITYAGTAGATYAANTTSASVTVNALPTVTFTADATSSTCSSTNVTYTTQSGMTNYLWTVPGTLGIDYSITSGGIGTSDNSVTLQWLTAGTKTITVNYTNSNGCTATSAASSTPTTILMPPTITSVSPTVAIPGNSVTITGTNFNTTAANNYVYFGSVQASVASAGATSLTVTAPIGSVYNPSITVENSTCALSASSPSPFLPTYNNTGLVANTINFATRVNFTTSSFPNHLAYGDLDGDRKVDIITGNYNANTLTAFLNTGTAGNVSFALPVSIGSVSALGSPSVGDIDGDGLLDVVVMSASQGKMYVFRNTSTVGNISFASAVVVNFFTNANASSIIDIDGDGKPDIVGNFLNTMSIFRNTSSVGNISFASRVDFTANTNINAIATGDIDGDGKPDILIGTSSATVSAFLNTSISGTISLATRQDFTILTGATSNSIAIVDIDGDGKFDLLTTEGVSGSASLGIFPGGSTVGTISFGTRQDFTTGNTPDHISIGDFDGDSKPDIAVTSVSAGKVNVFRNTSSSGTISLASKVDFTTGSGAADVVATDIDGDGKTDIVTTNQSASTMSVLLNNPLSPITAATTSVCVGSTITLSNATSGGTWSSSNTSIAAVNSSTGVVTGVGAGTVTITYAGTAGSSFADNTTTTTVTVNAQPTPTITGGTSFCSGSSLTLDAGAGYNSYAWSTTEPTETITVNTAATYNVTVIDNNGCSAAATPVTVTINQLPTPTITGLSSICSGTSTTIDAGAGYNSYAWSTGAVSQTISVSSANTYTVTVSNSFGCTATASQSITITTTVVPSVTITQDISGNLCPNTNVTFTATPVNGGTTPSYQWLKNGSNVGSNSATYSDNALVNGDVVSAVMTSNNTCASPTTAASNSLTQLVLHPVLTNTGNGCINDDLIVNNAGSASQIVWQKNGTTVKTVNDYLISTVFAGNNGADSGLNQLNAEYGLFRTETGNIYVADRSNHRVIKFVAGSTQASYGTVVAGGNGAGSAANQLHYPTSVVVDGSGNLYVCDQYNHRVQKFPAGGTSASNGVTVAGITGSSGAANNRLFYPNTICFDASGNLYVSDNGNNRVQKFAVGSTVGTTVAGGNGVGAGANQLNSPTGIVVDGGGNLFVSDQKNNRVQKFPSGSTSATNGTTAAGGNGQGITANKLYYPAGLFIDGDDNLYVADWNNYRIQQFPSGSTSATNGVTVAGNATSGSSLNQMRRPQGVAVDAFGTVYVSDQDNNRVSVWGSTAIDSIYHPAAAAIYNAVVTFAGGCVLTTNLDTIKPTVSPYISFTYNRTQAKVCNGTNITFAATTVNGGTAPHYQWKVNSHNVGTDSIGYTYVPVNNDTVTCLLTSNAVCTISPTAVSGKSIVTVYSTPCPHGVPGLQGGSYKMDEEASIFNIYPNPATSVLNCNIATEGNLQIVNEIGQAIITQHLTNPSTQININQLTAGVYFYTFQSEGQVFRGKIVKE